MTGKACGIEATSGNGGKVTVNAKSVVIATGGFGYDLQKCYELKPSLTGMITNNQVGATGDGIYMAEAVGANLIDHGSDSGAPDRRAEHRNAHHGGRSQGRRYSA